MKSVDSEEIRELELPPTTLDLALSFLRDHCTFIITYKRDVDECRIKLKGEDSNGFETKNEWVFLIPIADLVVREKRVIAAAQTVYARRLELEPN